MVDLLEVKFYKTKKNTIFNFKKWIYKSFSLTMILFSHRLFLFFFQRKRNCEKLLLLLLNCRNVIIIMSCE